MAAIFDDADICQPLEDCLEHSFQALIGDKLSMPVGTDHQLQTDSLDLFRNVMRSHKLYWNTLWYDVKLPDSNVLIPPWMNDEKVLKNNPEITKLA